MSSFCLICDLCALFVVSAAQAKALCRQSPPRDLFTLQPEDPALPLDSSALVLPNTASQDVAGVTPLLHAMRSAPASQLKRLLHARLAVAPTTESAEDSLRAELHLALVLGLWEQRVRHASDETTPLVMLMDEPAVRTAAARFTINEGCVLWFFAIHTFARLHDPCHSPPPKPALDPLTWLLRSGVLDWAVLALPHQPSELSPLTYLQSKLEMKVVDSKRYKLRPSLEQIERDRRLMQQQSQVNTKKVRVLIDTCLRSNLSELCATVGGARHQTGLLPDLLRMVVGYLAPIDAIAPGFQFSF